MKKPELLVTPTSVAHIEQLAQAGANAVIIGEQRYGLRLAGEFSRQDVIDAMQVARKTMYVYMWQ